jgi:hypothetical protein
MPGYLIANPNGTTVCVPFLATAPRPPTDFEGNRGPQVHLGAALWDRGNVIIGFYGMYENPTNDRRTSIVDLGLIVSNDAISFREPVPDFKIVPSLEEPHGRRGKQCSFMVNHLRVGGLDGG